jgi:hypothetical protein
MIMANIRKKLVVAIDPSYKKIDYKKFQNLKKINNRLDEIMKVYFGQLELINKIDDYQKKIDARELLDKWFNKQMNNLNKQFPKS